MARRVNTKFLIVLTVGVIGVGLAGLIVAKLHRGDPAKYLATAAALAQQHKFEEAAKNYQQAVAIDAKQPNVWVAYGDTLAQLVQKDPDNGGRAFKAWQQAMELDPNNKEALSRMLQAYLGDTANASPNAGTLLEKGRNVAMRLAKIDPTNKQAVAAVPLFMVRSVLYGVTSDPQKLADAAKELADLSAAHPEDPELTSQATDAKFTQAQLLGRTQPAEARKAVDEAGAIMKNSLKAAPNSAAMQFQAATVFTVVGGNSPDADTRKQYSEASKAALAEAIKLSKPTDDLYGSIQMAAANQALGERDRPRAEKIARDLLGAKPDDAAVRIQVAELIAQDPGKRREAIEILDRPVAPQTLDARKYIAAARLEIPTVITLTNLRLDEYAATTDPTAKQKLQQPIEDGLSKLAARVPNGADNPLLLKLRGKFQRLKGDNVAAIQTLSKAVTLMDQQDQPKDGNYYDTVELLARAYADGQQTGSAKELLSQIVAKYEKHVPSRLLLARLLVQSRDFEGARPHIEALEKMMPDLPEVIKLRLATLDKEKDKEQIKALFARLPESTRPESFDKANTALALGDYAEAERLLGAELAKAPGDPDVSLALARINLAQNKRDKANAIVADALKAHPDSKLLQLAQKQLSLATPEEMRQFRLDTIEQTTDPAQKALQLADLAAADGKPDEALKQLLEAEKASPDNLRIKDALFNQYLARKQWDDATRYMEALAKANNDKAGGLLYRVRFALNKAQAADSPGARQAEVDKAVSYGRDLTSRLPEFGQSWLVYGQALQASGKFDEATQRFATALEKQPDSLDAMRGMVECFAALNRPSDVKRYIDAALKLQPNNSYFLEQQTNYELAFGDPTKALPQREAALKVNQDNAQAWLAMAQTYLAGYRYKAGKQDEAGANQMLAKAADTLKQAIAKFPDDRRFYAGYVDVALTMKDPAGAEAMLKQLTARDAWKDKPDPQLMMADFLARTGKLDDAEALLKGLIAKDPANVTAQLGLVSLLTQRGKGEEAIKALQTNQNDPRVREQLAQLQLQLNKLEEADKTIQAALAADPKSVRYQAFAGYVSMARGRWDEANERLNAALKLDGRDPRALYYAGLLRLQQPSPNVDEAVQRLTAAREGAAADAGLLVEIRYSLANALRRRGDLDGASREMEAALQAQPTNKRLRMSLIDLYMPPQPQPQRLVDAERTIREGREIYKNDTDLMRAEAVLYLNRKEPAKAVAAARAAVAAAPKDDSVLRSLLGILQETRDYKAALKEADQMLAADKNRWWALLARGVAKRYSSDKDGALQDFEGALTLAQAQRNDGAAQEVINTLSREIGVDEALTRILPRAEKENRWRFVAAQLYQAKGDTERGIEMVDRVLAEGDKLSPSDRAQTLRLAGALYLGAQPQPQAQKAYETYLKVLDLEPNDWPSLNNMACLVAEQLNPPRPKEALQYSQKAYDVMLNSGGRNAFIYDTHGWVLTLNDRPQEGIDMLRQAVTLEPFFPESHYHLGEAYLRTKSPVEAQKQLELAAEQIRQAEDKKQAVSPGLSAKVDAALNKAKEIAKTKTANAAP